jgi:regulatory protein
MAIGPPAARVAGHRPADRGRRNPATARAATGATPRRFVAVRREVGASELPSRRRELQVKLEQPPVGTGGVPSAQVERALEVAYGYLNKRERTAAEVTRRLRREGLGSETIAQTVALLHDEGTLDDRRFARLFTDDKRTLQRWGSERIRRTLIQRGVDSDTVASVVDAPDGEAGSASESERERALAFLRSRFPERPRSRRDRDRALGALLRKGYDPELAFEALAAYSRD